MPNGRIATGELDCRCLLASLERHASSLRLTTQPRASGPPSVSLSELIGELRDQLARGQARMFAELDSGPPLSLVLPCAGRLAWIALAHPVGMLGNACFTAHGPAGGEERVFGTLLERFRGCLLGGAVGDALGMPTEVGPSRQPGQSIRDALGVDAVKGYMDSPAAGFLRAGQYTDDTQQVICLAETLIEGRGEFSAERFLEKLESAIRERMRGVGPSTRRVLDALQQGRLDELRSGCHASPTPSNGAAMRIAPLALLHFRNLHQLRTECLRISALTHSNPTSIAGAAAMARAIAYAMTRTGDAFDAREFRREVASFIGDLDPALASTIAAGQHSSGNGCLVVETIPEVLASFATRPDDFQAGVLEQANSEGDTDTKASMLGSLLGARNGVFAVPEDLLHGLEGRDEIDALAVELLILTWIRRQEPSTSYW